MSDTTTTVATATAEAPAKTPTPADVAKTAPAPTAEAPSEAHDVDSLPAWAQAIIRDARSEAAKARVTAKEHAAAEARQAVVQDIAKTLGLAPTEQPPTLEEVQAQAQQALAAQQQATLELAVYRAAAKNGADPDALLDSRTFVANLTKDGHTPDAQEIDRLIAEHIAEHPTARAAAASPSSPDITGPAPAAVTGPIDLGSALRAAFSK